MPRRSDVASLIQKEQLLTRSSFRLVAALAAVLAFAPGVFAQDDDDAALKPAEQDSRSSTCRPRCGCRNTAARSA
jgi:hypothetical protein